MKYLGFIAIVSFIAIAVFGFAGFSSHHDTAFMVCAENLTGHSCTNSDMALLHTKIYQGFSSGILVSAILGLLALVYSLRPDRGDGFSSFVYQPVTRSSSQELKIHLWYELQQKRDPLI